MNPIKWAKRKVNEFLNRTPVPSYAVEAAPAVPKLRIADCFKRPQPTHQELLERFKRSAEKKAKWMAAHGVKWFFISTQPIKVRDPKTGEDRWLTKKLICNMGKNKAKRAWRHGLSGKSARRRRIGDGFMAVTISNRPPRAA